MTNPNQIIHPDLDSIVEALANANRVAFFTGAGISAESGLPTYRGVGGLYNEMVIEEGLAIEEILSGDMFAARPELTWKYIAEIEHACRGKAANAGHLAIAQLENFTNVTVITQNVDGFHNDAGSSDVIELHGNLRRLRCTACANTSNVVNYAGLTMPPHCSTCGAMVRPEVVLFGEMLPAKAIAQFDEELAKGFDLIFAIGTTAGFPYISEPIIQASANGITTVEINPDLTPLSNVVTYRLSMGAAIALPAIYDRLCAL